MAFLKTHISYILIHVNFKHVSEQTVVWAVMFSFDDSVSLNRMYTVFACFVLLLLNSALLWEAQELERGCIFGHDSKYDQKP